MSASIGLSAASETEGNSLLFQNTPSATVPGRENAFRLHHVGDACHIGNGAVFPMFIWICNNWVGASQSDIHQPIRMSASVTKEAVYRPMRGANRGGEQTRDLTKLWYLLWVQSGAVTAQCDITWYCIHHCSDWGRIWTRVWIHKNHLISHPNRQAMGCLLQGFKKKN